MYTPFMIEPGVTPDGDEPPDNRWSPSHRRAAKNRLLPVSPQIYPMDRFIPMGCNTMIYYNEYQAK